MHRPEALLAHEDFVRRIAGSLLGGGSDVDDVVQDAWLRSLQQEQDPRVPRAWLARVTRNLAFLHYRKGNRQRARERRAAHPDRVSSTADVLAREELRRKVFRAVLALKENQRECIVARYFDGLPPREIAQIMSVPVSTVRSRIRRGRAALRMSLEREFGAGPSHWLGSLVLLSGRTSGAPMKSTAPAWWAAVSKGVAAMAAKTKLALVLALAAMLPLGAWQLLSPEADRQDAQASGPSNPQSAKAEPPPDTRRATADGRDERSLSAPHLLPHPGRGNGASKGAQAPVTDSGSTKVSATHSKSLRLSMKREYERLRGLFVSKGWLAVRSQINPVRAQLESEEGAREFLRLLDTEEDGFFLEALLHHLTRPGDSPESLEALIENEALHREIWSRFEREENPLRRASYLSFFNQNPRLRGKKTRQFLRLATSDPVPRVRSASLDALWSIARRADVWPVLCDVAATDRDERCRAAAIRGLTRVDSKRAAQIVRGAFESPSEMLRTAVWESRLSPPAEVVGEDLVVYLRGEFRRARTNAYKSAILDRLVEQSVPALQEELERVLRTESDGPARRYYRAVLEILAGGGIEDRWDVHRHAKSLYLRFRHGGG